MTRYHVAMLAVLGLVAAVLSAAMFYEHVDGQDPCPLCLMQRLWFMLAGLLAWIALIDNPGRPLYNLLVSLAALGGSGFSLRQLYLQQLPADQLPACSAGLNYMIDVFPAMEVLRAMVMGTGTCGTTNWSLLGLSMAGWALLSFIGILVLAVSPYLLKRT